jgi:DNA (cytosine-5)-methyltransferase 1/DNA (cytosine-5)-methyltransferase 3A
MKYDVVASFFDGKSGTMIALDKLGITPKEYYAFEIDPYSEAVSRYNYPNIIRLGNAINWNRLKRKKIDLFVAGFPCQSYSVAGLRQFQDDPRDMSKVLLDAIKGLDVDKVLIENVASMPRVWKDYFTEMFKRIFPDIECYELNSANDSAQNRKRLYWTNIKFTRSGNKSIVLNDILEDGAMADRDKSYCLDANYFKGGSMKMYYEKSRRQIVFSTTRLDRCKQVGEADLKGYDIIKRVYDRQGKSPALTTMQGGWRMPKVHTLGTMDSDQLGWRALTPLECERLQTIPDGYTEYGAFDGDDQVYKRKTISNSQRYKMLGNGFCVDTV